MTFPISPGVYSREVDLTATVPATATSIGAFVGGFRWGPVEKPVLVGFEDDLVARFGRPRKTDSDFFVAAQFLLYGNALRVVRVAGENAANAHTGVGTGTIVVKNDEDYEDGFALQANGEILAITVTDGGTGYTTATVTITGDGTGATATATVGVGGDIEAITVTNPGSGYTTATVTITGDGADATATAEISLNSVEFLAAYPGALGNALEIILCPSAAAYAHSSFDAYRSFFTGAPATSVYAEGKGKTDDEMHVVVVDKTGAITGTAGTVLETYEFVSQASDAKTPEGGTLYYVDALNRSSRYVRFGKHPAELDKAGVSTDDLVGASYAPATPVSAALSYAFANGADGDALDDGDYLFGLDTLINSEDVNISLLFTGNVSSTVKAYAIQAVAEKRGDAVAFVAPAFASVVNNKGNEVEDVIADRNALNLSSSYGFMVDNWKNIYDKYNDRNLWIPITADIAGLCAATDAAAAPWVSPAGYTRGILKNVTRLAWSASEIQRDELYSNNVNSVINKRGVGVLLFGDKTLLARPSAFDRINVRRLFITLRTRISRFAETKLFELNTEGTRSSFKGTTDAYLSEVRGGQGVTDFAVICDETNNTPERIDRNEFYGDIFVKPTRSINFIRLSFVATRSGVDFSEVIGNFA